MGEVNAERREQLQELKAKCLAELDRNPNAVLFLTAENARMLMQDATAIEFYVDGVEVVLIYADGNWSLQAGL